MAVPYDPERHHRRSIRLRGYDYTQAGAYFFTICTQDRACLFGDVIDGAMRLNDAGLMVQTVGDEIPEYYPGVDIDAFIIMPNHIHGIIVLPAHSDPAPGIGQPPSARTPEGNHGGLPLRRMNPARCRWWMWCIDSNP